MISLVIVAALLMLAATVLALFWPLLKQPVEHDEKPRGNVEIFRERLAELDAEREQGALDEANFQRLRLELEKNLLADTAQAPELDAPKQRRPRHVWLAGIASTLAVLVSLSLYLTLGRSDDYFKSLMISQQSVQQPAQQAAQLTEFKEKLTALEQSLEPTEAEIPKWHLLARSYLSLGEPDKAVRVFKKLLAFVPESHADLAAFRGHYAQALFLAADETVTPDVEQAIRAALALDDKETSALTLQGIQAFDAQDFSQAIAYWQDAKINARPEQIDNFLDPAIANAKAQAGIAPDSQPTATLTAGIDVMIDLAPELKNTLDGNLDVFVFAKKPPMPMPLAAVKLKVAELPKQIRLDDSASVMPQMKLSSASDVVISARVSQSGQAQAQPGDWVASEISASTTAVSEIVPLIINQRLP